MANHTYYVTTDSHGYPWGESKISQAHFDLGDNTPSNYSGFLEAPHDPVSSNLIMRVLGNHDEAYYKRKSTPARPNLTLRKTWTLDGKTICALGFNTATDQNSYDVSLSEILAAYNYLENGSAGMHVMVLTHNPLFEPSSYTGKCYDNTDFRYWYEWGNNKTARETIVDMLLAYRSSNQKSFNLNGTTYTFSKTGYVIGCFCGHIHNHVQCHYRGIYMEAFGTNGACEWRNTGSIPNAGLYTPPTYSFILNPTTCEINGKDYDNENSTAMTPAIANTNSGTGMGDGATGAITTDYKSSYYPKFRQSRYLGYSEEPTPGVQFYNNNDGFWYVRGATLTGSGISGTVEYIRFDAAGKLRYYSQTGHDKDDFSEIPGYNTKTIAFTANGYTWKFVNGLYNGYTTA